MPRHGRGGDGLPGFLSSVGKNPLDICEITCYNRDINDSEREVPGRMSRHYGPMAGEHRKIMRMLPEDARPRRAGTVLAVLFIVLILAAMSAGAWYWVVWRDGWGGTSEPGHAAAGWVGALNSRDDAAFDRYMIPAARKAGYMSDPFDLTSIRRLHDERHMVFGSIEAGEPEYLDGAVLEAVRAGMAEYGSGDVSAAARVDVSAEMSWSDTVWSGDSKPVSFPIVCVERHGKWYVYTGRLLDEEDAAAVSIDGGESALRAATSPMEFVPEPFTRERRPLERPEDALSRLSAGEAEIEGNKVSIPCGLTDLAPLLSATEEALAMEVAPNGMVDHLPITMADEAYAAAWAYLGVANPGDTPVPVSEGLASRLWIGLPLDGFSAYPEVYLPGNVTLGTTYDEAVSVYGELEPCDGGDRIESWSADAEVYSVPLGGGVHNKIYLQFVDEVLSAIGWDYYDFNSYSGDLS